MSELLTLQDLANGHLDIKALGEAANGDENTIVTTRTGNTYPSAERAINIMFQNGGLPATPFATKALMTASALVDGKYAMVTDDSAIDSNGIPNNGLYLKETVGFVRSSYDPQLKAIEIAKAGISSNDFTKTGAINLVKTATKILDKYLNKENGALTTFAGAESIRFKLKPNTTYSIYSTNYAASVFLVAVSANPDVIPDQRTDPVVVNTTADPKIRSFTTKADTAYGFMTTYLSTVPYDIRETLQIKEGMITDFSIKAEVTAIAGYEVKDQTARDLIAAIAPPNPVISGSVLSGKKWLAIGDSITEKNYRADRHYHEYVSDDVGGMTVYNYGISGSGYYSRSGVAATITQTAEQIDLITVFWGTNDWGAQYEGGGNQKPLGVFGDKTTATIAGCIYLALDGLLTKFPLTKLAVFTPLPRSDNWGNDAANNAYGYNLPMLCDMIIKHCEHLSLPCLDLYRESNLPVWKYQAGQFFFKSVQGGADGLHPNAAGQRRMADKIRPFLESI